MQSTDNLPETTIPTSDVVCSHGMLDPDKAGDMKVIRAVSSPLSLVDLCLAISVHLTLSLQSAHARIAAEDACHLVPKKTPSDVCPQCVERMFKGAFVALCP